MYESYLERNEKIFQELRQQSNYWLWNRIWFSRRSVLYNIWNFLSNILWWTFHVWLKVKSNNTIYTNFSNLWVLETIWKNFPELRNELPAFYWIAVDTKWKLIWTLMEDFSENRKNEVCDVTEHNTNIPKELRTEKLFSGTQDEDLARSTFFVEWNRRIGDIESLCFGAPGDSFIELYEMFNRKDVTNKYSLVLNIDDKLL